MNCQKTSPILSDYLDGRLDVSTEGMIRAHLQTCRACEQELTGLRKTVNLLTAFEPTRLSREFDAKLFARLDALDRSGGRRKHSGRSRWLNPGLLTHSAVWKWTAAAGTAAVASLAVWQLAPMPASPSSGGYIAACIQAHQSSAVPIHEHTVLEASPDPDIANDTD